jgi:hypothetical protein
MPDIHDYIEWGKKMVSAARGDDGAHKEEILDGVEGHFESIEREVNNLEAKYWLLTADGGGHSGIGNVMVIQAESKEAAREKADDYVSVGINYGKIKVRRIDDLYEHGDVWSYYI